MIDLDFSARLVVEGGSPSADNDNLPVAPQRAGYITMPRARGPYIAIYGGGRFYPFDPRASEVDIRAIAHSLARVCRYTGHGSRFLSVAEHSVHICDWLWPRYGARVALAGLLHDAPEALSGFGDVARPSKDRAPIIKKTEERIWQAVAAAFCLSPILPDEVHEADGRIIADEMAANMGEAHGDDPLGVTLQFWDSGAAELVFLARYRALVAAMGREMGRAA